IDFVTLIKAEEGSGALWRRQVRSITAPGVVRFAVISGRGFPPPEKLFSNALRVDLFDCSGKRIRGSLDKNGYLRFIREKKHSGIVYVINS
ncbi:MAG: hypothetical protein JXA71_04295, partial [Chitinispirillaceae bacterium]|nr:hypothetical protein [Chitinispirillaceae bacterium]